MAEPPGSRESFFRAMREAFRQNADNEILEFAQHPNLPELLELESKDLEPFRKQVFATRTAMQDLHGEHKDTPIDHDRLVSRINEISSDGTRKAIEALEATGKWERVVGLFVQLRGSSAAATGAIAEKIALSGEQLDRFRKARSELWEEHMKDVGKVIQSAMRSRERDPNRGRRIAEMMREAQEKTNEELRKLLTPDQQTALDALRGEAVNDINEKLDFRKRSGRGGRGPRDDKRGGEKPGERPGDRPGEGQRDPQRGPPPKPKQ